MTAGSHVLIVSMFSRSSHDLFNSPREVHGPFRLLAQAEYAARMLRRVDGVAEVVPGGRDGPWWVRAAPDAADP